MHFFHTSLNIRNNSNKMRGLPKKCYPTKDSWLSLAWWHFVGELTAKIHPCTFICCLVRMEKTGQLCCNQRIFLPLCTCKDSLTLLTGWWQDRPSLADAWPRTCVQRFFEFLRLGASNVWMLIWMFKAQMIHLCIYFSLFVGNLLVWISDESEEPLTRIRHRKGCSKKGVLQAWPYVVLCWLSSSILGMTIPRIPWDHGEGHTQFIASSSQLQWANT